MAGAVLGTLTTILQSFCCWHFTEEEWDVSVFATGPKPQKELR